MDTTEADSVCLSHFQTVMLHLGVNILTVGDGLLLLFDYF